MIKEKDYRKAEEVIDKIYHLGYSVGHKSKKKVLLAVSKVVMVFFVIIMGVCVLVSGVICGICKKASFANDKITECKKQKETKEYYTQVDKLIAQFKTRSK